MSSAYVRPPARAAALPMPFRPRRWPGCYGPNWRCRRCPRPTGSRSAAWVEPETKCRVSGFCRRLRPEHALLCMISRQENTGWPMAGEDRVLANGARYIDFQTDPSRYRHWKLEVAGDVATLTMDVDENGGLFEGYQLNLNSYDLGVYIELADAVQRLRFEHPDVKVVVLRSGKNRVFCAGANIRMLAGSTQIGR